MGKASVFDGKSQIIICDQAAVKEHNKTHSFDRMKTIESMGFERCSAFIFG